MLNFNTTERIKSFLDRFSDKGLLILKTAYEISQDPYIDHKLGDFSFKHLVLKLSSIGFIYNPANLLRMLEREYGVIEKSYSSSNQTWWRFVDIEAVRRVLSEFYGTPLEDPETKALFIKYKSIEPRSLLEFLKKLVSKESLSTSDRENFKNFVFNELDKIVELVRRMEKYEEVFSSELTVLREILNLADLVSNKLEKPRYTVNTRETGVLADANTRTRINKNSPSFERDYST